MFFKILRNSLLVAAVAISVAACSDDDDDNDDDDDDNRQGTAIFVLTGDNKLLTVEDNAPGTILAEVSITGLAAGHTLQSIDVRPNNGRLYGLATDGVGLGAIYHIDVRDGVATQLGAGLAYVTDAAVPVPISGTDVDLDFNPQVDRIRIVSSGAQSFRANPNNGAAVDGDGGGAAGTQLGTNADGGTGAALGGAAYTNSTINQTATTLYTVLADGTALHIQNPPNAGTQTLVGNITVNGEAIAVGTRVGFDIPRGVDTVTANAAVTSGHGYLAVVRDGGTELYRLDLTNANATSLGTWAAATQVRDIAVWTPTDVGYALSNTTLSRFAIATPTTTTDAAITGINAGEVIAGIEFRPATGQLVGLGYSSASDTATYYIVDPQSGAATAVGTPGNITFQDAEGTTIEFEGLSIGYNNTADRLRVVGTNGVNFRVQPDTGIAIDGNFGGSGTDNTNPDGALNGGTTRADGVAYIDRNPTANVPADLFVIIDSATDTVFTSESPNAGTVTSLGALGVDATGAAALADGADGAFHAALTVGTSTGLYSISVTNGAATLLGAIGSGATAVQDLAIVRAADGAARLTRP